MKNPRNYMDLGSIFDELFKVAEGAAKHGFRHNFNPHGTEGSAFRQSSPFVFAKQFFDENTDFYPNYSYPPMNIFMTEDRSLVFEFALAGFAEKDISLFFQGDYMVFSAKITDDASNGGAYVEDDAGNFSQDSTRYFKRRLKMKNIDKQKYFVPLDKYAQTKVKAVFKNGILKVTVPPKDEPDSSDGIKVEIMSDNS